MANRKQQRAYAARRHIQTEIDRKLHRATTLAKFLPVDLQQQPYGAMPLWLPFALDYIADDLRDLQQLISKTAHTA